MREREREKKKKRGRGGGREKERQESAVLTGIFLNELVDVDPAACAACVKHDPVENPAAVEWGAHLLLVKRARRVRHFGGHMVSVCCGVDDFGRRVDRLRDHGEVRGAGLRRSVPGVGNLRQEVLRVGGVLPVAGQGGHVAVVTVVSRLG